MSEPQTIIIDNGSGMVKAGFAGEDAPRAVFPAIDEIGNIWSIGFILGYYKLNWYVKVCYKANNKNWNYSGIYLKQRNIDLSIS